MTQNVGASMSRICEPMSANCPQRSGIFRFLCFSERYAIGGVAGRRYQCAQLLRVGQETHIKRLLRTDDLMLPSERVHKKVSTHIGKEEPTHETRYTIIAQFT